MTSVELPSARLSKKAYLEAARQLPCVFAAGENDDGLFVALQAGWHWQTPGQFAVQAATLAKLKAAMLLVYADEPEMSEPEVRAALVAELNAHRVVDTDPTPASEPAPVVAADKPVVVVERAMSDDGGYRATHSTTAS